jgi:hypothetical protein
MDRLVLEKPHYENNILIDKSDEFMRKFFRLPKKL